jgi:hypothetical protein
LTVQLKSLSALSFVVPTPIRRQTHFWNFLTPKNV